MFTVTNPRRLNMHSSFIHFFHSNRTNKISQAGDRQLHSVNSNFLSIRFLLKCIEQNQMKLSLQTKERSQRRWCLNLLQKEHAASFMYIICRCLACIYIFLLLQSPSLNTVDMYIQKSIIKINQKREVRLKFLAHPFSLFHW